MVATVLEAEARASIERRQAVRLEGNLFSPDLIEQLRRGEGDGQRPGDFDLPRGHSLLDEIAAAYRDALGWWAVFRRRLEALPESDRGTSLTREEWIRPLLHRLGYELARNPTAYRLGNQTYFISHRAGRSDRDDAPEDAPPVHVAGARQELGRVDPSGVPRLSPHALVQEYLNRSDHLWGLVTNGLVLRVLRASPALRRQAYLEFDLEALFEGERFDDFALLYRLLHRSRLPDGLVDAERCWLERYYQRSLEEGSRARDRLRDGVERCLLALGNGFLNHPKNRELRQALERSNFSPDQLYAELLRLVYRLLFLLVVEERGLLGGNDLYRRHYSVSRLRALVDRRVAATEDDDLWLSLLTLWQLLRDSALQVDGRPAAALLGLHVLDGGLFAPAAFESWRLTNRDLLEAVRWLVTMEGDGGRYPVNYAALDVEELGSVYESLLENQAEVKQSGGRLRFEFAEGTEKKLTGSYYTPHELVSELVQSALVPVVEERLRAARTPGEKERAILELKVCDPASGSGHFLLAAARELAKRLAQVRTGEEEPAPERLREALRDVVRHCLYAVDKNPLAVELCKLALWIEGHAPGLPLTFLDHHVRCGDSLVGVFDLDVLVAGIPDDAYEREDRGERQNAQPLRRRNRRERTERAIFLDDVDPEESLLELGVMFEELALRPDRDVRAVHALAADYECLRADPRYRRLRRACDLWTAAFFADLRQPGLVPTTADVHRALAGRPLDDPQRGASAQGLASELRFFHWPLEFPDVFAGGGFDVVLGNPPFMGGLRISGTFGARYRKWLEAAFQPFAGTADLCAVFFRRAFASLRRVGRLGMVATNTISQGDTRESGLAVILREGGAITFARRFVRWPGTANVEVNLVSIQKRDGTRVAGRDTAILDGVAVPFISSRLDSQPEAEPRRLVSNEGRAFIGDLVRGIGFVLEPREAERLLAEDPRNADCLLPYLNGEDVNSHPEQKPSRYAICFHDWDLEQAKRYPALLRIVEERVKPERDRLRDDVSDYQRLKTRWWNYAAYAQGMRRAIAPLQRVLVRSEVSQLHMLSFVPKDWIYSHMLIVFAFEDDYHFALLQSTVHEAWVWRQASSLESRNRYTPTDCFDTFPFPFEEYRSASLDELLQQPTFAQASCIGAEYHEHRRQVMLARNLGLTQTYNLFHNPACTDTDIARLHELHMAMDNAVLACYGWQDLDLHHDFYQNERGQTRFTVSPDARRELLKRLLELNLEVSRREQSVEAQG